MRSQAAGAYRLRFSFRTWRPACGEQLIFGAAKLVNASANSEIVPTAALVPPFTLFRKAKTAAFAAARPRLAWRRRQWSRQPSPACRYAKRLRHGDWSVAAKARAFASSRRNGGTINLRRNGAAERQRGLGWRAAVREVGHGPVAEPERPYPNEGASKRASALICTTIAPLRVFARDMVGVSRPVLVNPPWPGCRPAQGTV